MVSSSTKVIIITTQWRLRQNKQTNKNLRCGNRKGLLGRNDQTHHRMGPKTMESIPPSKRNTQADIQLRTRQTNHQQETDGCIQIKHNPEHQPSRMSSKSTAYVPPKTASTPTKANTQTCSYLDFNQFLITRITRNIWQYNNKHLRCGNRKGLLGRNDQTHHRMDPSTMASRPPTKQY